MQPQPRLSFSSPAPTLQQPAQRVPVVQPSPTITLYRDGLANLNGDATRALGDAQGVLLLAPTTPGTRWQLIPRPTPAGAYPISGRTDRGNVRFRAAPLAAALFAALPPTAPGPLYLEMVTSPALGFELVALHNPVQQ